MRFKKETMDKRAEAFIASAPLIKKEFYDGQAWQTEATEYYVDNKKLSDFQPPDVDINMNGFTLNNLPEPINPSDAATKQYVDNGGGGSGGTIVLTGDIVADGHTGTPTPTVFTRTLNQIPNAGNVDIAGFSLKNLKEVPENELDAVSFSFFWKLINDKII